MGEKAKTKRGMFYSALASSNIRRNIRFYLPYILCGAGIVAMFYIMCFITDNSALKNMHGSEQVIMLMRLGMVIIGIFSTIILFYINSFLIKRRKNEIGLLNVLGMEKKQIALMMTIEGVISSFISISAGLFIGILFSKLCVVLLINLIGYDIYFGFSISLYGVKLTCILFIVIYTLSLLDNLRRIGLSNPMELLRGTKTGEKEPKTKIILTLIGLLSLGTGYYIAIVTEKPLEALLLFFVAVLLVIIGTYCLFIAGSIAVLKLLRSNKKFYYKSGNFMSVSGMIYRMKQNAVGLAGICILSTMVLVTVSTTVCLYSGMEDSIRSIYPRNIMIKVSSLPDEFDVSSIKGAVEKLASEENISISNAEYYKYLPARIFLDEGNKFFFKNRQNKTEEAIDAKFISDTEYNRISSGNTVLSPGEAICYSADFTLKYDKIWLGNNEFILKECSDKFSLAESYNAVDRNRCIIVLSASDMEKIIGQNSEINDETDQAENELNYSYCYNFDSGSSGETQSKYCSDLSAYINNGVIPENTYDYISCADDNKADFMSVYGALFFMGMFLGLLFAAATAMIMYYKQISEGYDDKDRFEIMQKVGMSREEVRSTIQSQVLTVFFLPLLTAAVHIIFAFKMITRLLMVLNLTNVNLFLICTVVTFAIFALLYVFVYAMTAKTYYKIVALKAPQTRQSV
ncbi:ABC transporter permease protein YxdM [bioreactor metagenome]|uniref:ABC transporter permease protein YxdM n=1 Tax=bioreactor metagenome TaxID=1076179 RepID=A0A644ZVM9_9ZZZZ|nr:FtsX-like permease family protein [Oscillospiraceae bacterium]